MNSSATNHNNSAKEGPVINHIAVYVFDLKRSTDFYSRVLHLENIPEPFKDGKHSWFQIGATTQLHLIEGSQQTVSHNINNHLSFGTAAFDEFVAQLKEAKVLFYDAFKNEGIINIRPDGIKQIFFQDPDGYWLEMNNEMVF